MNWLDPILAIIILLHLVNGFSHGLVRMFFDIIGFMVVIILSLLGSRLFGNLLAGYIDPDSIVFQDEIMQTLGLDFAPDNVPYLIAGVIVFLVLFISLSLVFRLFSGGFRWINRIPVVGLINRIGGGVLGILVGAAFVYIIIVAFSLIPLPFFINALNNSGIVFYANIYVVPYAQTLKEFIVYFYLGSNG